MWKHFLFKRPDWFKHEGYWRLAQVFRLGPAIIFVAISAFALAASFIKAGIGEDNSIEIFGIAVAWFAGAVAYIVAIHWLIRLIVWIIDGFKESRKPG